MQPTSPHEEIIHSLVHDLRQPLSNLETCIFWLDMVLEHPSGRVGEHLHTMENQIAQATRLLQGAVEQMRALRAQTDGRPFEMAKAAAAGVAH